MNEKNIGFVLETMRSDPRAKAAPVHAFESAASNPFQILVSTMLSARTKDSTTIPIAKRLFKKVKKPEDVLKMNEKTVGRAIFGIGFYRTKAKYLVNTCAYVRDLKICVGNIFTDNGNLAAFLSISENGKTAVNHQVKIGDRIGFQGLGYDVYVKDIKNGEPLGYVELETPK